MRRCVSSLRSLLVLTLALASFPASSAALPVQGFTLPVLRSQVPAGVGTVVDLGPAFDPARKVDGEVGDWKGSLPGFGGAEMYSHGELVYQDHIFDAYGPTNAYDATRMSVMDPVVSAVPEFYRLDPAYQYLPGEFGVPTGPLEAGTNYGKDPMEDQADLSQVRLGTDPRRNLWLLARTTTMDDAHPATALLLLLRSGPVSGSYKVPFNSGLTTSKANLAVFLHGSYGAWVNLARPNQVHVLPAGSVATNAQGYNNAIEARLPASLLDGNHEPAVAVAAGLADPAGTALATLPLAPNVANVAFRTHEPARDWWDKDQALELHKGTIDEFFTTANLDRMAAGTSQRYVPGPGYHDRIFTSTADISKEQGQDGILQHYGVYLPSDYVPGRVTPTQYWFHFRGGNAHIAAAVVPGVIWDMGEYEHSIVITPDGRGEAGWYVGQSQEDVLQVWADSHRLFPIDRNRTYIAGHSMGGWASYLLPIEHPDWFAAAFPASGPVTQGAYTGVYFKGCDRYTAGGDSPCFTSANGGQPRNEYTEPLLANLRWVPYAIYQGTNDELVPSTGVTIQVNRLRQLGFRYEYYLFPGQEHYGPPIADQWVQGADYEHHFARNPNPPQVTYIRSMPFEHAIETVNSNGVRFHFPLDHAYWMSGLEPVNWKDGAAYFSGRSLAIPNPPHALVPETGAPATAYQNYPYAMTGQAWREDESAPTPTSNGFVITLSGARAVTLDTSRMKLQDRRLVTGRVKTRSPLALTLTGRWPGDVVAADGCTKILVDRRPGAIVLSVPSGTNALTIGPADDMKRATQCPPAATPTGLTASR
jgi:prolyl oligopeptidase family protein